MMIDAKVFAGTSNIKLGIDISNHLGITLNDIQVSQFNDGEISVEINEPIRGDDVFIIQSTCAPVNDRLMELLVMVDAIKRSHAGSIIAIVPYYGYSRQDRRPGFTRSPITSRLVADMMETAGIDYFVTVDIHSQQQQGFFKIPVTNVSAQPLITADIWKNYHNTDNLIVVSPDIGGVGRARATAKELDNVDLAIIDKRRPKAGVSTVMNIIGDVVGKHCVMVDDIIDTAGTLAKSATALKEQGAMTVTAYATHPVFSNDAYTTIEESDLDEVVVMDTIPLLPYNQYGVKLPNKIRQMSIGSLLAETIRRINTNQSVSSMYVGD